MMGWLAKSAASAVLRTRERKDSEDGCRRPPQIFQSTSSNRQTASPTASSTSAPFLLNLLLNPHALASVPATAQLPLVGFPKQLSSQLDNLSTLLGFFGKSARFHVPKNSTLGAETKKPTILFNANIPPKWFRTCLFYAFIIFGWVLRQFSKIAHFLSFLRRFYCYMGEKLKLPWYQGRWPQIKKCKKTN